MLEKHMVKTARMNADIQSINTLQHYRVEQKTAVIQHVMSRPIRVFMLPFN